MVPAANSCVVVFPRITAPPSINACTDEAFAVAGATSSRAAEPHLVGQPATSKMSLMPIGMPCSGPRSVPLMQLLLGLCGGSQRLLGVDEHPGVKLGLSGFDPLECRAHDLDWRPRASPKSVADGSDAKIEQGRHPRRSSHRSFRPRGREGNQERRIVQVDGIEQQRSASAISRT